MGEQRKGASECYTTREDVEMKRKEAEEEEEEMMMRMKMMVVASSTQHLPGHTDA